MSYLCDIYEKIIGACGFIAFIGVFLMLFCPVITMTTVGMKKVLFLGIFLALTAGIIFLFLPSKEFVCGA